MTLDRMSEARESLAETQRLHLDDSTDLLSYEYFYYYLTGDKAAMAQMTAKVAGREDEFYFKGNVAWVDEFAGQYRAAEQTWNQGAEEAALQKAPDGQASAMLNLVSGRALAGDCRNAEQTVKQALALDRSKPTLVRAVLSAALCNDRADALPLLAKLDKEYPEDTVIQRAILPESRAALALAAHQPQAALHELQGSKAYYLVGIEAYAIEAYQRATKYKGNAVVQGLQDYGAGLLGLARAYTMTGDKSSAKKTYAQLLDLWKDADADLPQLLAAKREYAALQ
jgi:hypothetical protein